MTRLEELKEEQKKLQHKESILLDQLEEIEKRSKELTKEIQEELDKLLVMRDKLTKG